MRAATVLVKESTSVNNVPLADLCANNFANLYYTEEPPHGPPSDDGGIGAVIT